MIDINTKTHVVLNVRKIPALYIEAVGDLLEEGAAYWLVQLQKRLPPGAPNFPNYETNGRRSIGRLRDSFHVGAVETTMEGKRIELVYPDDDQLAMEIVVHERGKDIYAKKERVALSTTGKGNNKQPAMRFTIKNEVIITRHVHIRAKWFIFSSRGATTSHFYAKVRQRIRAINNSV